MSPAAADPVDPPASVDPPDLAVYPELMEALAAREPLVSVDPTDPWDPKEQLESLAAPVSPV